MLNRRSLRIKAMQSIYAYKQCQQSDYQIAIDQIKSNFLPDLNAMESPDYQKLEENKAAATKAFEQNHDKMVIDYGNVPEEIKKTVSEGIAFFRNQTKKDLEFLKNTMVVEAEKISDRYLLILLLIIEFSKAAQHEIEEKNNINRMISPESPQEKRSRNIINNKVISALKGSKEVELLLIKRNISWKEEMDQVRHWYKDIVKKDEAYKEYDQKQNPGFEDDKKIITHLVKNNVFKNEAVSSYFEEIDLSWAEDKAILKSMVIKTLKSITENKPENVEIVELSNSWEEDKEFFMDLYIYTIEKDQEFEDLISKRTKNWDIERIAALDKIIIKMALGEMIKFPSIPVKVTINEYIEISKIYSTPKSRQFINGLLDVLATELQSEGIIRKSGRGLIDNK